MARLHAESAGEDRCTSSAEVPADRSPHVVLAALGDRLGAVVTASGVSRQDCPEEYDRQHVPGEMTDRRLSDDARDAIQAALPRSGASSRVNLTQFGAATAALAATLPDGRTIAAALDALPEVEAERDALRAALESIAARSGPSACACLRLAPRRPEAWCTICTASAALAAEVQPDLDDFRGMADDAYGQAT